jgi:hypothetical protein
MKPLSISICLLFLLGCEVPAVLKARLPLVATPPAEPSPASGAATLAKANAELLSEMMKVVFHQSKIEDPSEFGALVHSLNQGASLEGIYRGLVMGNRYRSLESEGKAAAPKVLKIFLTELAEMQTSMKNPTVFEQDSSNRVLTIEYPDAVQPNSKSFVKRNDQEVKAKKDRNALMQEYLEIFIGASPFTLKRILAEEGLKRVDELKDAPGELGQWYAQWVLQMAGLNVDFGLEQRRKPDFDFHFNFAQKMAPDRVKWEVLNRVHRILNHAIEHER